MALPYVFHRLCQRGLAATRPFSPLLCISLEPGVLPAACWPLTPPFSSLSGFSPLPPPRSLLVRPLNDGFPRDCLFDRCLHANSLACGSRLRVGLASRRYLVQSLMNRSPDSYLETMPTAYKFYKEHWEYRRFRFVISCFPKSLSTRLILDL